jgi:acyl dehydratase
MRAFRDGALKVSHPPIWLKFRQCFRFEPDRGLRRTLIGRKFRAPAVLVNPQALRAYGEVVGDPETPLFPVTLVKPLFMALLEDPDFTGDVARMVHGEQDFEWFRPLRPKDLVVPRGVVSGIEDKSTGQILSFEQRLYVEGEPAVRMVSRLFFRSEEPAAKDVRKPDKPGGPAEPPGEEHEVVPAEDLPRRYAAVSGDDNPIHLDPEFARSVGFRGVILHGLCTLALAVRLLPRPLRELSVRFAKPAYPGERLTVRIWRAGGEGMFDAVNAAGEQVLALGKYRMLA